MHKNAYIRRVIIEKYSFQNWLMQFIDIMEEIKTNREDRVIFFSNEFKENCFIYHAITNEFVVFWDFREDRFYKKTYKEFGLNFVEINKIVNKVFKKHYNLENILNNS